jgi:hypothetical protein
MQWRRGQQYNDECVEVRTKQGKLQSAPANAGTKHLGFRGSPGTAFFVLELIRRIATTLISRPFDCRGD